MRRPDPVTKQDVVAAAAELFAARGFQNTRADDIAEALNIAKPTLYARTQGKGELLEEIMGHVVTALDEHAAKASAEDVDALQTLRALFEHHVREAIRYQAYFNVVFMDERELPEQSRTRIRAWGEKYTRRVEGLVSRGIAEGLFAADLDPKITAHTILAAANWVCVWYRPDGRWSADDVAERSWRLLEDGLVARARGPRRRASRRAVRSPRG